MLQACFALDLHHDKTLFIADAVILCVICYPPAHATAEPNE
jgi:hypothetical protein